MPALCLMLLVTYFAGIISQDLQSMPLICSGGMPSEKLEKFTLNSELEFWLKIIAL